MKDIKSEIYTQTGRRARYRVRDQTFDRVWNHVERQLRAEVWDLVELRIWIPVDSRVRRIGSETR